MCKFTTGDKVERIGLGYDKVKRGEVYKVIGLTLTGGLHLEGAGSVAYDSNLFKLAQPCYPNPPHKHAELIKAWADGAQIQSCSAHYDWRDTVNPSWIDGVEYRIKPEKSEREIQIEELEKQARELADKISELKNK